MDEQPYNPHLHPLNQAAALLLRKMSRPPGPESRMAAIDLALVVISTLPPHAATEGRVADLQQWDSDPKWQRLALLILEKQLLPQQMLMTSPAIVGAMIADALGNQKK